MNENHTTQKTEKDHEKLGIFNHVKETGNFNHAIADFKAKMTDRRVETEHFNLGMIDLDRKTALVRKEKI